MTARNDAITLSKWWASTCSPSAPIARLEIVTPSCIAEMNRGGSLVIRRTARARLFPSCSSSRMRVRREVTRPYSAATKNAFSDDQAGERQHLEGEGHRERPEDARVLGGRSSSTRISRSEYSQACDDTNICSIMGRCGSSTGKSRARSR